ncbi:putative D,D-dipeptide-binding periplasmic protein DdpA precursor [Aminobacter sp. MSH1]|uniref:ABC transporter substrate-binding protein n=1 Tax=Aminobacter sp. MSH1 TaxID=374606 RepID=UPI000D38EB1A|nr:ABC transporter substrate-binding protein [Aminobacter sp. MSH1]AWC20838.1 putative D,D-dipeptide-binding periplasmic protein DdpA precursor [Aminobacter sp. MSH1]
MSVKLDRRTFLLASSATALLPFAGFARAAGDRLNPVIAVDADIGSLDPGNRVGTTEGNIIRSVCQTLVRFEPGKLSWSNDAAKEIRQISDTEFEFELNAGQMFTGDFGEMTAEDVKYSFDRFINGDNGKKLAYADDMEALKSVEITGKYTGKLILKHRSAALWLIGICDASGAILSKKACEQLGDKIATTLIGSGPLLLKDWRPKEQFLLAANPDYKGPFKARVGEITGKIIPERRTSFLAYQAKELDFTAFDADQLDTAKALPDTEVIDIAGVDYTWIGINVQKGALADVKVRQAIRWAIDVDAIIEGAYAGATSRAKTLLAPGLLGNWADAPLYNRDLEKAQALLAETGLTGLTFSFTCLNDATSLAVAQIAQANLAEVGITLNINPMDSGAYWALGADNASKDLELTLIPYTSKFDPSFQTQWFLGSQVGLWNWQHWNSPEFDKLHQQGVETLEKAQREAIYIEMQKLLDESASCIWITHGRNFFVDASWLTPMLLPNGKDWQFEYFDRA